MLIYCSRCEYWIQEENNPGWGQCRRRAPEPEKAPGMGKIGPFNYRTVWLYTRISDMCGEGNIDVAKVIVPEETRDQEIEFETIPQTSAFDRMVQEMRGKIK